MFVRRTQTRSTANGEPYFTHRLVCSFRTGARVRQRTLLNLGRHFALPQSSWPLLCSRVEQILIAQHALPLADVPRDIEQEVAWIPNVARREWTAVSSDRRLRSRRAEGQAIQNARLRLIVIAACQATSGTDPREDREEERKG